MYRLNYPEDPGMHTRWMKSKNQTLENESCSIWNELQHSWLTVGFIFSLLCFAAGLQLWNEGNAVQNCRSLEEGLHLVRKLTTTEVAFEENNNKLVYLVGRLATDKELSAEEYGVSVNAVKLRKRVEMYQWAEEEISEEVEDGDHSKIVTSFSYYKTWAPQVIQSDLFHNPVDYVNPKEIPMSNSVEVMDMVKIGNFILSKGLVNKINNFQPFTGHIRPQSPSIKLHAGLYYHTDNVWNPQIGDIRVEFARAGVSGEEHMESVTIVAKQEGRMLSPYITESGETVLILQFGRHTPEEVFHGELSLRTWVLWLFRVVSFIMLLISMNGVTNLLTSMAFSSVIMHDVMQLGTSWINFYFTTAFYLLILGISWIRFRPYLGLLFLVLSTLPFGIIFIRLYRRDHLENQQHRRA